GKRRDRITGLGVKRIIDLQQDRPIPLDDEWIGGIVLHGLLAGSGIAVTSCRSSPRLRAPALRAGERSIVDGQSPSRKIGSASDSAPLTEAHQSAWSSARRSNRSRVFIASTRAVARPVGVSPKMMSPRSSKCSYHRSLRGLNRG